MILNLAVVSTSSLSFFGFDPTSGIIVENVSKRLRIDGTHRTFLAFIDIQRGVLQGCRLECGGPGIMILTRL